MTSLCGTELEFHDGAVQYFSLAPIKALRRLDEACGCGPEELLARLSGASFLEYRPRWQDLREIVRCGLIGGAVERGQEPNEIVIAGLVQKYVDGRPRSASYMLCRAILLAYIAGMIEIGKEDAKKNGPGAAPAKAAGQTETASVPAS